MKQERTKKDWSDRQFTESEKTKIVEKLITARVGLLLKHPFFGNLATRMKLIDASEWCSTRHNEIIEIEECGGLIH